MAKHALMSVGSPHVCIAAALDELDWQLLATLITFVAISVNANMWQAQSLLTKIPTRAQSAAV